MKNILNLIKYLFSVFWGYSKILTIVRVISYTIIQLEGLIYAFITARLIDVIIESVETGNTDGVLPALIFIAGFLIFMQFVALVELYTSKSFGEILRSRPKIMMYTKLNKLSVQDLEKPEIQNKLQRFEESIYATNLYINKTLSFFATLVLIVFTVTSIAQVAPILVILLFGVNIPIILFNQHFIKKLFELRESNTEQRRRVDMTANNLLDGNKFKEVKLMNAFGFLKNMYEEFHLKYIHQTMVMRKIWYAIMFPIYVLQIAIQIFGMYLIVNLALEGSVSIGDIAFYFSALSLLAINIRILANEFSNIRDGAVNMQDTLDLHKYKETSNADFSDIKLDSAPQIVLRNVTFSYPGSDVKIFESLNLTINSGERIALVGENGAGKTTLIKLISGVYNIDSGNIYINGVSLYDIDPGDWYRALALLFQDFNIYEALTVEENIAIGDTHKPLDSEGIKTSAEMSDAKAFIEKYPSEYNQILSEKFKGGIRPSGGQWQKIAIARFFYRNSPLLILDEPTSAIDAVAEANIFDRIYKFVEDKTVIIVSHRFSTVRNADRIVVLEQGKIVEEGTHKELIKNKSLYYKMFNTQAVGYK